MSSLKDCLVSAAEYSCSHHCLEDKEEDGADSCVECWANCEEHAKGKNKKKKRKSRGLLNANEHVSYIRQSVSTLHTLHCSVVLYDYTSKIEKVTV